MKLDAEKSYQHSFPVEFLSNLVRSDVDSKVGAEAGYGKKNDQFVDMDQENFILKGNSYGVGGHAMDQIQQDDGPLVTANDKAEDAFSEDAFHDKDIMEIKMPPDDVHFVKDVCVDEGVFSHEKILVENEAMRKFTHYNPFLVHESDLIYEETTNSNCTYAEVAKNPTPLVSFDHNDDLKDQISAVKSLNELTRDPGKQNFTDQFSLKELLILESASEERTLCRVNFDARTVGEDALRAWNNSEIVLSENNKLSSPKLNEDPASIIKGIPLDEKDFEVLNRSNSNKEVSSDPCCTISPAMPSHDNEHLAGSPDDANNSAGNREGSCQDDIPSSKNDRALPSSDLSNRSTTMEVPQHHPSVSCNSADQTDSEGGEIASLCEYNLRTVEEGTGKHNGETSSRQSHDTENSLLFDATEHNLKILAQDASQNKMDLSISGSSIMSGPKSASGHIVYSGNISIRSESSTTSTRSFAFPVLQTDWNTSPVRMAKATRRRGWRARILCCKF